MTGLKGLEKASRVEDFIARVRRLENEKVYQRRISEWMEDQKQEH